MQIYSSQNLELTALLLGFSLVCQSLKFLRLASLDLSQLLLCQVEVAMFLHPSLPLFPEKQDVSSAQITRAQVFKYPMYLNSNILGYDTAHREHELLLELAQPRINNCHCSINLFFCISCYEFVQLHLSRFSFHDNEASAGVTAQHLIQGFSHNNNISKHLFTVFNQGKARMGGGEVRVVNLSDHWKPVHQPASFSGKQCQQC